MKSSGIRRSPAELVRTPLDVGLPSPTCDPLIDSGALVESYFFGAIYDAFHGRVGLLFGLLGSLCQEPTANVGLLLCSEVSEFGWATQQHDIPPSPSFWTVLAAELVDITGGAQVVIPSLAGWRPTYAAGLAPPFRYRLGLNPNSELIVAFRSAVYLVGRQEREIENSATRFSLDEPTTWYAMCQWPR